MAKIIRFELEMPFVPCEYCTHWHSAKRTGYQDQEDEEDLDEKRKVRKSSGTRKCLLGGKEVSTKSASCADFILHDDFWCLKRNYWVYVICCISGQKKNRGEFGYVECCEKCRQGETIWEYVLREKINRKTKEEKYAKPIRSRIQRCEI